MDPSHLETLTLSVSSLTVLDRCPRLFRYLYLDRLIWPPGRALEEEDSVRKGQTFHRLIELHTRGRSIETQLRSVEPEIRSWWQTFSQSPQAHPQGQVFSELPLWSRVEGLKITAKLDRLVVTESGLEIVDWKTAQVRPTDRQLCQDPQVKIYPLMVCLIGDRWPFTAYSSPQDIQITIWYVNHPDRPFRLTYTQAQFEQDLQELRDTVEYLKQMHRQGYPMTLETSSCSRCVFRTRCYGLAPEDLDPQQLEMFDGLVGNFVAMEPENWRSPM